MKDDASLSGGARPRGADFDWRHEMPRWSRIARMAGGERMSAKKRMRPPQVGHASTSTPKARRISSGQLWLRPRWSGSGAPRLRHERRQPSDELARLELEVGRAVGPLGSQLQPHVAVVE